MIAGGVLTPAQQLLGMELDGGWKVVERLSSTPDATGGHFSEGYIAEQNGRRAFLKALDVSVAFHMPDFTVGLQKVLEAYNFERRLLEKCRDKRLDRIVVAIADGTVRTLGLPVPYLIFDLADGDVRRQIALSAKVDLAWRLRVLHHVAVGLQQLHLNGMAHQDLKPSNVLVYGGTTSRLADLGRAAERGNPQPHDALPVAGDMTYAPPEQLYGFGSSEWNPRCFGADAYHLGSMLVYLFTGLGTTQQLLAKLDPSMRPMSWGGSYEELLPYLRDAFNQVMGDFAASVSAEVSSSLTVIARELCDPDPALRGEPKLRTRAGNQYAMASYISRFNNLALHAEVRLTKGAP